MIWVEFQFHYMNHIIPLKWKGFPFLCTFLNSFVSFLYMCSTSQLGLFQGILDSIVDGIIPHFFLVVFIIDLKLDYILLCDNFTFRSFAEYVSYL